MKSIDVGTVVLLDFLESEHKMSIEKGYRIIREWTCEHCNREIENKSMIEGMEKHAEFPESVSIPGT